MIGNTRIPGTLIESGSIPTTALGGGVVSSSAQIISSLPTGALSSSAQVQLNQVSGTTFSNNDFTFPQTVNVTGGVTASAGFFGTASYALTPAGTAGSSGTSGTAGSAGTSGTAGSSGSTGTSGSAGTAGSSGTSGSSGSAGSSGSSGATGATGSSGSSGSSGATGASGSSGSAGSAGSSGTSGTRGSSGSSGTTGANGSSGSSGATGANGAPGSSGSSGATTFNATTLATADNRTIAPSEDTAGTARFGFTSWANNNTAPYADYLHLRSYTDSSGGNDNLVMFRKDGTIGMRIWQQSFGSATAYSSYVDVLHSSNFGSYALPLSGGTLTGGLAGTTATFTGNVGIGTTNPANLLHVKASGNYGTIVSDNSTNTGGGAFGVRKNGSAIGFLLNKGSWFGDTSNDLCLSAETGYNIRFYTNGSITERFIIDTSGNVGIGTTSPVNLLHTNGSDYYVRFSNASGGDAGLKISYLNSDTHGLHLTYNPNIAVSYIDNTYPVTSGQQWGDIRFRQNVGGTMTTRMIIKADTSGNVGIGTTSPAAPLEVSGGVAMTGGWNRTAMLQGTFPVLAFHSSYTPKYAGIAYDSTSAMRFYVNASTNDVTSTSPILNITNSGNVGIGSTNPTYKFQVDGDIIITNGSLGVDTTPSATDGTINARYDIIAYSSDKRLKTNVNKLTNALEKVQSLSGFTYTWNELANKVAKFHTDHSNVGVFAQDVQEVLPEAIRLAPFDNDGTDNSISGENYLTVQYDKLVPLLIEAIKELKADNDDLRSLITELQNK